MMSYRSHCLQHHWRQKLYTVLPDMVSIHTLSHQWLVSLPLSSWSVMYINTVKQTIPHLGTIAGDTLAKLEPLEKVHWWSLGKGYSILCHVMTSTLKISSVLYEALRVWYSVTAYWNVQQPVNASVMGTFYYIAILQCVVAWQAVSLFIISHCRMSDSNLLQLYQLRVIQFPGCYYDRSCEVMDIQFYPPIPLTHIMQ